MENINQFENLWANVTFKKSCSNCFTYSTVPNLIVWRGENFCIGGKLISQEEMIGKITNWHREKNYRCENCGTVNEFDFWDVAIDDEKLKWVEPKIHLILTDGRLKVYELRTFLFIIDQVLKETDLDLTQYNNPIKNCAQKVIIVEAIKYMKSFFETDFLPSDYLYSEAFKYFKNSYKLKFNKKELNLHVETLSNWEKTTLKETVHNNYDFSHCDPEKILPIIYNGIPSELQTDEVYSYFRLHYFKARHRLIYEFQELSKRMQLKYSKEITTHIIKLWNSRSKLTILCDFEYNKLLNAK